MKMVQGDSQAQTLAGMVLPSSQLGEGDDVPTAFETTPGGAAYTFVASTTAPVTAGAMDIAALAAGTKWTSVDAASGKTIVTYSFVDPATSTFSYTGFTSNVSAFPDADKALTREILAHIEAFCDVQFVEVPDNADVCGVVRFGYSSQVDAMQLAGFGYYPSMAAAGGDVWLGTAMAGAQWDGFRPDLILHETLHALGLKHPFGSGVVLAAADNIIPNTVMSYSPVAGSTSGSLSDYPQDPMPLDVAALQFLYGSAPTNLGDTHYDLSSPQFQGGFATIADAGGTDVLDASALPNPVKLDLREDARSDIGVVVTGSGVVNGSESVIAYTATLSIAPGTVIENAIGSRYDDTITANAADNVLTGGAGNDFLDGGPGIDTAVYSGALAAYSITTTGGVTAVADSEPARDGTDTLLNMERLAFTDMRVALDLNGNAGIAARLVGALYGAGSIHDPVAVGAVLHLVDSGMAIDDVFTTVLSWRLGPSPSPDAIVDLLYTNVAQHAPSAAAHAYYVQLLVDATFTPASIAEYAADTQRNADNIDLVGLAAHGLPYSA
jgi:serralysin